MLALSALLGACFGLGIVALLAGLTRTVPVITSSGGPLQHSAPGLLARLLRAGLFSRQALMRAGIALACAALVGAMTRWPVGAALAAIACYVLPAVLGGDRHAKAALARTEAVAVWTEMLRDSLSGAAGLEQTILLTAPLAPDPIAEQVADLGASIRMGRRLPAALEEFAARVEDPGAALVARALIQASHRQSRHLPDLLTELARRTRERANLQLRLSPARAKVRTNARIIVLFTLALAAGMVVFNRPFLAPYDTGAGQLVLLGVALVFGLGFVWLDRLSRMGTTATSGTSTSPATRAGGSGGGGVGAGGLDAGFASPVAVGRPGIGRVGPARSGRLS